LEGAQPAAVAGPPRRFKVPLPRGEVVESVQALVADLVKEPLGESSVGPQRDHEPQPGPLGRAQVLDVAQYRVGAYQQPWRQQLPEPVQGSADAGQLGGSTRVGGHVQGDPLGGGGLQHPDLAGHAPVRPQPLPTSAEPS
jgi:hypothetical protein